MSKDMHYYFTNHLHLLLLLLLQLMNTCITSGELLLETVLLPPPQPPIDTQNTTLEYMDPTLPPLLPSQNPKCSLHLLQEDFADTIGAPPTSVAFSPPPDCPAPWSRVILDFSAIASDIQQDRIAAIWLDGAEILRTSTPLPMAPGAFWRVRKDITRYTALLRQPLGSIDTENILSMMLENSNATFPGVYSVNITLHFYRGVIHEEELGEDQPLQLSAHPTTKGLYKKPADKIIPISNVAGNESTGFWFQVTNETDVQAATVMVPNNTYRAVLEIYVSHHGDDDYWYANPLRSSGPELQEVGIDLVAPQANGGFRQVVALIDGRYAGAAIPFPVIHPGSVNPFFWAPVAAIGAYDHPSYDLDITPFVGTLLDGRPHEFGLTVRDCQPYWLVSANLHLWLDAWSDEVEAKLVRYKVPPLRLSRQADWKEMEGKSEMEGAVIIRFSGWVSSSLGNITTSIRHKIKFKSHIEVQDNGATKQVDLETKSRTNIRIERDHMVIGRVLVDTEAPLQMETISSNGGGGSRFHKTKLSHGLAETTSVAAGKTVSFSTISDRQDSEGSVLMQDGIAVWGKGDTKSVYKFRDDKTCYLRTVNMVGGKVKEDEESASCAAAGLTGAIAIATWHYWCMKWNHQEITRKLILYSSKTSKHIHILSIPLKSFLYIYKPLSSHHLHSSKKNNKLEIMHPKHWSIFFIVLFIHSATSVSSSRNGGMLRRGLTLPNLTLEHIDPTLPPVLPSQIPKCSVIALQQDFADTVGAPPASANYTQPDDCPAPWTRVVLELSVSASDLQKDRIAAVWVDGVEVLRTTTPLPMAPGAFWKVTKDITRYTAAIRRLGENNGIVSMMLENSNTVLPGVYSANVTLHFYRGAIPPAAKPSAATGHATIQGLYKEPADLIIPVARNNGYYGSGFWFRIENDSQVATSSIKIPGNTYRAVLEIFVSYHADDEFWFGNPLRASYLQGASNLSAARNNGGFRQVYATIDGKFVGGHIPFMVLYPGSVNPYFWSPVAAIGAFNMPSYDLDITPFLGMLLDGQPHELGLGVHDSQQYWLVGANLHIWVDMWSDVTQAGLINYYAPPLKMNRNAEWRNQDGQSEIDAEGLVRFIGWVSSSKGNITTVVQQKIKYKSQVEVQNRGAVKQVEVNNKQRMMVALMKGNQALARIQLMMDAPMQIQTSMVNAVSGAVFQKTRLYHQLQEMVNLSEGQAVSIATLTDRQDAEGSALLHDGVPVWGGGATRSAYRFKDDSTCYLRTVNTAGGIVRLDTTSASKLTKLTMKDTFTGRQAIAMCFDSAISRDRLTGGVHSVFSISGK